MTSVSLLRAPSALARPRPIVTGRSRLTTRDDFDMKDPTSKTGVDGRARRSRETSSVVVVSSLFVLMSAVRESDANRV
jgi:hypothetical protein